MEYLHAALLLHSAGKSITADNINKIFKAVGITADSARVQSLIAALKNVDIEEAIKSGPAFAVAPAGNATAASTPGDTAPAEEEVEEEEEEDLGLSSLFG
ncbi:MAG: 50S ribosomal protein L12 [Candidatus Hodarchaeota archaeon]